MNKYNILVALVFLGALFLRTGVALNNLEANDPHMPVIRYIMRYDELPEKADCWECFQPKLFHFAMSQLLTALQLEKGDDADAQKVIVQLVNVLAGMITLLVVWKFIWGLPGILKELKLLVFSFFSFNPQLIGINSQITNDTFVILFCVLAVFYAFSFIKHCNTAAFLGVALFSFLALLVKTNAWVTVIAITLSFIVAGVFSNLWKPKMLMWTVVYLLVVVLSVVLSPLSQYVHNYQTFGRPVLLNIEKQPAPLIFEKTSIPYAGILSIQDGFFTFKFRDLLIHPITPLEDKVDSSSHRTSFWIRLFGSANSVHFENYPPSWRTEGTAWFWVYRGIYILSILPTTLLLAGGIQGVYETIQGVFLKNNGLLEGGSYGLFSALFVGYILFAILYASQYRTYNVMKAVFLYPGLLAYVYFFAKPLQGLYARLGFVSARGAFLLLIVFLLILYIVDVLILNAQLSSNLSGWEIVVDRLYRAWR